jgi:hypothetical protein
MDSREVKKVAANQHYGWKPITELQTLEHGFLHTDPEGYVWWRDHRGCWTLLEEPPRRYPGCDTTAGICGEQCPFWDQPDCLNPSPEELARREGPDDDVDEPFASFPPGPRSRWLEYWEHKRKPWYRRLWAWAKWCLEPDPPPWSRP